MGKELALISAVPCNPGFFYQTAVNLLNQREYGVSDKARVLIFLSKSRKREGFSGAWTYLQNKFPETQFFFYEDSGYIERSCITFDYIPLIRPYMLQKHWEQHPELKDYAIYYHDSDTIFTKKPEFLNKYKDDDINYMSDTKWYINSDYFDSKRNDVDPTKLSEYDKIDVLQQVAKFCKTDRATCEANKNCSGGAQYLLKNIDAHFWSEIFNRCIDIKTYLAKINQKFFPGETPLDRENKGFQSFCADMWAILFTLWGEGRMVLTPEEMNFTHATDRVEEWEKNGIYHDAGAPRGPFVVDGETHWLFYKKGQYKKPEIINGKQYPEGYNLDYALNWGEGTMPFFDDLSYVSPSFCSKKYVEEIEKTAEFLKD